VRPLWLAASGVMFGYVAAGALIMRRLPRPNRLRCLALSATGLAICFAAVALGADHPLNRWIIPPALLLLAYWATGAFFVAPMPRAEQALLSLDRLLEVERAARATPRWLAEVLELAYALVYPVVPIALVLALVYVPGTDPHRFWAVVLITDYICFAGLQWVQTRPPRALDPREPWRMPSAARALNLRLLGATSIQVNTFPSGHAAEAMAAALLVTGAPLPVTILMFAMALAISAGAVLGRYHYAADIFAGWIVAIVVWASV
jgi:membrane-associated phospholipid phosphatase